MTDYSSTKDKEKIQQLAAENKRLNAENKRLADMLQLVNEELIFEHEALILKHEEAVKRSAELAEQKLLLEANAVEITKLAFYDTLTELPNRYLLSERLQIVQLNSGRSGKYAALMFLDMDRFKVLNDTLGHDYGDLMLIEVASRLRLCVRESDTVARLGGDEFIVLLNTLDEHREMAAHSAALIAEKIRAALAAPYALKNTHYDSSPSIGVTLFHGKELLAEALYKQADIAMYKAKNAGGNSVYFYDPSMALE
jgi:diguanylate cyclase (GGDEF)-like protein